MQANELFCDPKCYSENPEERRCLSLKRNRRVRLKLQHMELISIPVEIAEKITYWLRTFRK